MAEVADNAIRASMAYRGAVEDYGNFIDSAMREYGWTMPDATGSYSVQGAQDAFDPDRTIQFDASGRPTGTPGSIAASTSGGQYGTTGLFARTAQESAALEAQEMASMRGRGFGAGSGLGRQVESRLETGAKESIGEVSKSLFGDIFSKYGALGKQYEGVKTAEATDAMINAQNLAMLNAISNPVVASESAPDGAAPTASTSTSQGPKTGDIMPSTNRGNYTVAGKPGGHSGKPGKPGEVVVGSGGVTWVYRTNGPKGANWYKKG